MDIGIAAGRMVKKTPNPPLTRLPYIVSSALGTNPADALTPNPGFRPFHDAR